MSIELKVKSNHLSEEARIIRFEEYKQLKQYRWALNKHAASGNNDMYEHWNDKAFMAYCSLSNHRKWDVRNENRATFLARAYIAGKPYRSLEQKRKDEDLFSGSILPRVFAMVVKYDKREVGDWEFDRGSRKYIATQQLKDKIIAWCELKQ